MCDYRQVPERTVDPGQIWLIEQPTTTPLSPRACAALASANVAIYDRALAPLVAETLPVGMYAEAWSPEGDPSAPVLAPRAVKFAAEGWRVVQLIAAHQPCQPRHGRLRDIVATNGRHAIPVRIAEAFGDAEPLALIIGPLAHYAPIAAPAFTANGLAG